MKTEIHRIMVIRHAEKPNEDGSVQGVDSNGNTNPQALSVLGWQRAGALVGLFTGLAREGAEHIETPEFLFAPRPTEQAPSERALQTLQPLAGFIGKTVSTQFRKGQETELVAHVAQLPGAVLVAWEHKAIPDLGNALMGGPNETPQSWPEDRFDLVWVFERAESDASWRFFQVPEQLLSGDRSEPI